MQSNGISSPAVKVISVWGLWPPTRGSSCHPSPGERQQPLLHPNLGVGWHPLPLTGFTAVIICEGAGILALASCLPLADWATHRVYPSIALCLGFPI